MSDIEQLQVALRRFNEERDWDQFHNGKDLAIGLSIEASELLEPFLWKDPKDVNPEKIREELADVLNYAFQMADKYGFDIKEIMLEKIRKNAAKYPVENPDPGSPAISSGASAPSRSRKRSASAARSAAGTLVISPQRAACRP